jgi:ribosomal protein S18 acetylase RimI-like enzyme
MLRHLEGRLAAGGVEFLQVKTLSGAHPDPGYAATRAFYLAYGFRPLEEFPTLWDPSNPALQLIKAVPQLRRPGPAQRSASGRSAPSRSASSAVVIRPFRPDDLESIVTLSLRAWEPVFASIYATLGARLFGYFFGDDWRTHQERDVRRACAAYHVSVADNRGRVDGFTAVDLPAEGVEGEIYMVAVDPSAQGAGLGTALTLAAVDQIERAGKQVAVVDTGADPGHAAARATYHKAGFTPWPSERFYRLLGDPATVYETDLS